jgi:hypothetical protein
MRHAIFGRITMGWMGFVVMLLPKRLVNPTHAFMTNWTDFFSRFPYGTTCFDLCVASGWMAGRPTIARTGL